MVVRLTFLMVFVCKYKKEVFMQLLVHARRERGREDEWWSRSGVDSSGFVHLPIGNSPVSVAVTVTVTKQSEKMKGSGGVVASVIALSTVAVSSSSAPPPSPNSPKESERGKLLANDSQHTEKFEPRFDGLRFIETLITAHR
ncbi:PREDICTED: uncharacterized protein LOC104809294 isoform X2 [Tarenaya hassleriana]|uniref:uncharacterized protein LOC104809294 isoform X2 n=1 Tax=Tarenaya hassleriana TaxID=28532 RepID=UPI0008FCE1AE|nr:PREDICTED: uncharacterized protein LOC104809294 isoform X2 [Tarenaya hassleriana]